MSKMKKDPNVAWKGEGVLMAQALENEDGKNMGTKINLDTLANAKRFVKKEWPKRKAGFKKAWEAMTPQSREDLIRTISPFTPTSPSSPILTINGKDTNVQGACIMFPHLCISELIPGNKLLSLLDSRADPARDDLDWIYLDYDFIKSLIVQGSLKGNVTKMEKKVAFLQPPEKFGECLDIKVSPPPGSMLDWFKKEIIVNASTFSLLFNFQHTTYGLLSALLEEVNTEIYDKENVLNVMNNGCPKCGKLSWAEDSTKGLKLCTCKQVAYCSREY